MKTIIAAVLLTFAASVANASGACGYPPYPPYGMKMICICDQNGTICQWIAVSK